MYVLVGYAYFTIPMYYLFMLVTLSKSYKSIYFNKGRIMYLTVHITHIYK